MFVYVGDEEGAREFVGEDTEEKRFEGGIIVPGFGEGHGHVNPGSTEALFMVDLFYEGAFDFARCGNPSTDSVDWKAYSADDQNVLVIAGPGDVHIEQGLLADQYKAVLPLVGYYQFMDKFFTPSYLLDVVDARD